MPPWLFLSLAVSLLAALGYQIGIGRSLRRVPLYWAIILGGFLAGEVLAESLHLDTARMGELQLIPDLIGLGVALALLRLIRV